MDFRETIRRLSLALSDTIRGLAAALGDMTRSVWTSFRMTSGRVQGAVGVVVIVLMLVAYWAWPSGEGSKPDLRPTSASAAVSDAPSTSAAVPGTVNLSDTQLVAVKVEPVEER